MSIKQNIFLHGILPLAEHVVGTNAHYWYRQISNMQQWSKEEITSWQNKKLQQFIQHAYHHTVYYHNLFDSLVIKPEEIRTASDLQQIPVITKSIANAHHDELVPDNLNTLRYREGRSGGTTGEPFPFLCDENVWGYITAAKIFYWSKTSYRYGDAFVALGSNSLFLHKQSLPRRIYDRIRNEHGLNSTNLTEERCANYVAYMLKHRIRFLYGYAAAIYILTQYVSNHNIDLTQIEAVFPTSENLTDENRSLIEQTYHCKVVDGYGARDAGITAYETAYHHYCVGYNTIAEIINPIASNTGTLLSTNFLNYSFPLIRYQFGDEVEIAPGGSDDYNGQVFTKILGRTADVLRLENGRVLTATGIPMILRNYDIIAFTITKNAPLDVTLKIQVNTQRYTQEQEQRIFNTLQHYVGNDCHLSIEHIEKFEPQANGKHRYFFTGNNTQNCTIL